MSVKQTKDQKDAKAFIVDVNQATNDAATRLTEIMDEIAAVANSHSRMSDVAIPLRQSYDKIAVIVATLTEIAADDKRNVPQAQDAPDDYVRIT